MSDYDDGFDAGILHQCFQERHEERVKAFKAIRRAAAVARDYDGAESRKFDIRNSYEVTGDVIRKAIRTAIGSEKA